MTINQLKTEINRIVSGFDAKVGLVVKEGNHTININENMKVPAASVIKIPIIMEAFRQAEKGELNLSENVYVPADAKVGGSGVLQFLSENTSMTMLDVLTLMIIVSDNTASNMILERVGLDNVNDLCRQLECYHTDFKRYFMDMESAKAGLENTTTAADMIRYLEEMASPQLLTQESARHIFEILMSQQVNAKLPAFHSSDDVLIANKTGELENAEHDVGIFQYQDSMVFVAVLMYDISDQVAAQQAIARVGRQIIAYLTT